MSELRIEYHDPNELKPYENNARDHKDVDIEAIRESIREFGFNDPIGIWSDENLIVEGHGRQMAAIAEGLDSVPCIRLDHLTDEQRRAYALAHNKTAELSEWIFGKLNEELAGIQEIDMSAFGFEPIPEPEPQVVEDEIPEEAETRCKPGDLWKLGNHRLICGDSTDVNVIDRLMDGVKADMVFTDSPYGVNIVNDKGKVGADNLAKCGNYNPIIGDDTTETAQQAYNIYSQLCDKMILWGGNYFLDFLPASDGWIIWDKETTGNFADGEMAWCSFHTPVRIYHQLWNGMIREGEHEKRVHPTQKPVRMLGEVLKDFTSEGDIVVDVFGGGSTLIACEQLNRKCFMCELDEHYCDVIIDRWEQYTGKKAVLINE